MQGGNDQPDNPGAHDQSHAKAPVGERRAQAAGGQRGEVEIAPDALADDVVTWEASEYIHHQKSAGWFLLLGLGTAGLSAGLYLLIGDIFSIIVLVILAVTTGIFAARPPRTLRYSLSHSGLSVDKKRYPLDEFRSYSLAQEGAILSITFLPTRRFMVPVTVYFSPQDEAKIIEVLAANLPHEARPPDMIDRWSSRLRF